MARPRSEEAHRAALDATVTLLVEQGIEGVTWEEVAARSGVARSTLARHFDRRETLIAKAAESCQVQYLTPDSGSLAEDLRLLFAAHSESSQERCLNDLLPILIDAARREPAFDTLVDDLIEGRRRPIRTVLQLAQLRGEIAADLDLDTAFALIVGPFTYRRIVERGEVTPEFADSVLRWAIAALGATAPPSD